jgi:hypothetical protein
LGEARTTKRLKENQMFGQCLEVFESLWSNRNQDIKLKKQAAKDAFMQGMLDGYNDLTAEIAASFNQPHQAKRMFAAQGALTAQVTGYAQKPAKFGRMA